MAFETWTLSAADKVRRNRLIFGYVIGASTVGAGIAFVVLTSTANVEAQEEEEAKIVEVQLAKEPEPEPEPEPPPPELRPQHSAPNPGPRLPKLETPTTISNDKLEEKEAKPSAAGNGDPYEKGGGDGSSGAQKAVVEAPAPPPPPRPAPKVNKPRPMSETDTAPEAIGPAVSPDYPPDIKAAGIEGTVLIRYVVSETGEIKDVKAVKGPPELYPVCIAAVKAMRFKPARDEQGNPFPMVRYKSFRFHIRT